MNVPTWLPAASTSLIFAACVLYSIRIYLLRSGRGNPAGRALYVIGATLLVAALAIAGALWWKRQIATTITEPR